MADHGRITAWLEVRVLPSPPRILVLTEIFRLPANSPEWAGLFSEVLSLQRRPLNLHSRFGRFVSALKIPFPRTGDFGSKRPVRALRKVAVVAWEHLRNPLLLPNCLRVTAEPSFHPPPAHLAETAMPVLREGGMIGHIAA